MIMIIIHNDKCISAAGLQGKGLHDTVFADTVWPSISFDTGVCEKKILRKMVHIGMLAFRAPNQGTSTSTSTTVSFQNFMFVFAASTLAI